MAHVVSCDISWRPSSGSPTEFLTGLVDLDDHAKCKRGSGWGLCHVMIFRCKTFPFTRTSGRFSITYWFSLWPNLWFMGLSLTFRMPFIRFMWESQTGAYSSHWLPVPSWFESILGGLEGTREMLKDNLCTSSLYHEKHHICDVVAGMGGEDFFMVST